MERVTCHKHFIPYSLFSFNIIAIRRVVIAIGEHIATKETLPSTREFIRIDESADLRIIVTALQVIQARLLDATLAKTAQLGCFGSVKICTICGTFVLDFENPGMGYPSPVELILCCKRRCLRLHFQLALEGDGQGAYSLPPDASFYNNRMNLGLKYYFKLSRIKTSNSFI